jgi:hypothetical protein
VGQTSYQGNLPWYFCGRGKNMVVDMSNEIPSDEQVMYALASESNGLTPDEIISYFDSDHELSDIIEAIQRVLDRGKVILGRGGRLQSRQELQAAA